MGSLRFRAAACDRQQLRALAAAPARAVGARQASPDTSCPQPSVFDAACGRQGESEEASDGLLLTGLSAAACTDAVVKSCSPVIYACMNTLHLMFLCGYHEWHRYILYVECGVKGPDGFHGGRCPLISHYDYISVCSVSCAQYP